MTIGQLYAGSVIVNAAIVFGLVGWNATAWITFGGLCIINAIIAAT